MMTTSVKNKIRLGTLFLFLLVVASGGFSIYYLAKLKGESENVLKANYESIQYCLKMQNSLDSIRMGRAAYVDSFHKYLRNQQANITERGEKEATGNVELFFNRFASGMDQYKNVDSLKYNLQRIQLLNMTAIKDKNNKAEKSVTDAMTFLITIIAIIFLVGFTFAFNFPSILTSSIRKLTAAIQEIGKKNYSHRVHIESKDEFGQLADAFNEMAARLEYFESSNLNKLIFEKSRAEAVINSLKDASIGIDGNNVVLFANQQALQLLGLMTEQTVGKSTIELSNRNDLFKFLVENEGKTPFKIVVDGKENYYVKEMIEIQAGTMNNKVYVLKNITSYKELDVAKTDFIATISHELKTPLASSDFSLKLLEDERIGEEERKELITQLKNDNQRMLRILSELLNLSQVETGRIQLDISPVKIEDVITLSMSVVSSTAREKNIHLERIIDNDLPLINADADKTAWVLNNFLVNAIKYSPVDSTVSIVGRKNEHKISIAVTDKGNGIESVYLDRIFERYFQVPGRSDKKGSGIGLAICKEFIEAMGGRVWVSSEVGVGSTFGFDLGVGS